MNIFRFKRTRKEHGTVPSKALVKTLLRAELERSAKNGYEFFERLSKTKERSIAYDMKNEYGDYQIELEVEKPNPRDGSILVMGDIDGPGVSH